MRILALIVAIIAVAVGCAPRSSTRPIGTHGLVLDAAQVAAIAREAVTTNDTWIDRAEFHSPERQPDGSWSVFVERHPVVPGGHRLILIDKTGKVTAYVRGA